MAIQVRRGNEADFDASKMLPGEWAVSLDTQYVRMCFAPGVVLRMATYEGFENEKAQIQSILAECQSIQSAVERIQAEVNAKASLTIEYSNFAKESADKAYKEAERAKIYASNAEAVTGVGIATQDKAGLVKGGDIYIDENGALVLIKETTESSMPNSHAGRLLFTEIKGAMEQGANPSPTNPQEIRIVAISGIRTHDGNGNESTITFSQPIELGGIGNYQDVIGSKNIIRRIGKYTVTSSDLFSINAGYITIDIPNVKAYGQIGVGVYDVLAMSNYFRSGAWSGALDESVFPYWNTSRISFKTAMTIEEFMTWVAEKESEGNPLEVYFVLAEETTEELPLTDQIALNSLQTFDGITYVEFISEIKPTFKGEYGTSKVGGYTLEGMLAGKNSELLAQSYNERLSALEASVVNNI